MKAPADPSPPGIVLVDKPRGPTSFDIVATMRRRLGERRVGHAGTLDPMATGLLVVLVGEATKLEPYLSGADKVYLATVALGAETTSGDADGEVIGSAPVPDALRAALAAASSPVVDAALDAERARTSQVPPSVSAIHVDGERSHARVRRGETVVLPPRPVRVHALDTVAVDPAAATLTVRLVVTKGYYVRAFARDLGAALGVPAHLVALRRERSGSFSVTESRPPGEVDRSHLVAVVDAARRALPVAPLTDEGARRARQGKALDVACFDAAPPVEGPSAWCHAGVLVAVGSLQGESYRVLRGFSNLPPLPTPPGEG